MLKRNLAIFDFCETLVSKQTADDFVYFYLSSNNKVFKKIVFKSLKSKFISILSRLNIYKPSKSTYLMLLKGEKREDLNAVGRIYAEELIREYLCQNLFNVLKSHSDNGDEIVILSGGYDLYLKYCWPNLIDNIICTKISFSDDLCDGSIQGLDCLGYNKITLLNKVICNDLSIYKETYFYTDHVSDLPLLSIVSNPVVVNTNRSNLWAKERGFKIVEQK